MARIAPGVIPIKDQNPYETIRAIASCAVEMNDVVFIAGYTGDVAIVEQATAYDVEKGGHQKLFIARTGCEDRRALWIQPWRIATKIDTAGHEPGDPVYLGEDGAYAFEVTEGMYERRIGDVVDEGVIHFDFDGPTTAYQATAPVLYSGDVDGTNELCIGPILDDIEVIDVWAVYSGNLGVSGDYIEVHNGKGAISSRMNFDSKKLGAIVRSQNVVSSTRRLSSGSSIHLKTFGKTPDCTVHILARRI